MIESQNFTMTKISTTRTTPTTHLKVRYGPNGVHVFNRATGTNVLLDEVPVPWTLWAAAPRHVSIALTNDCNLHCPHCFAPKNPAKLDPEVVIVWLDELDQNGCLGVGFGGGEPTLYEELPEICRHTAHYTGLAVTLTTNAQCLDKDLAVQLKGNVHFIRVSVDGIGDTYERLRERSFSMLVESLYVVRELAPFGINFLVNSRTVSDLDAAAALAAEMGAKEFLLLPEQAAGRGRGIDDGTVQIFRNWVNSYRGTVPLRVSEAGADGLPTCNPLLRETGLRSYAHIDASGRLKRSSFEEAGVIIDARGLMHAITTLELTTEKNT